VRLTLDELEERRAVEPRDAAGVRRASLIGLAPRESHCQIDGALVIDQRAESLTFARESDEPHSAQTSETPCRFA
jgi:hypothetical protein